MTIFLSSTCYDLTDLRAEVEKFLASKGHTILLSDRHNFPVDTGIHRHDVCIDNVAKCDLFVLVLDNRYGANYYKDSTISITWAELREAVKTNRQAIAFVRKTVFNERQTCRHNQKMGNPFAPFYVDNIKTFDIIDEIQKHSGIWMQPFEDSTNVKETLENIYATKHSPLNPIEPKLEISSSEISLTALSGSTASFITTNYNIGDNKKVNAETLQAAIDKIPENVKPWGEILGFESIPNDSNDYFYFSPLRHSGDEGEMIIGISPTALGRSVRNELQGALKKINDENNAITFFTDTIKRSPILCRSFESQNKSYIIGFYEKASRHLGTIQHLCILHLFANKWQIFYDQPLDEFECFPELSDNCEIIIHDKKIYFYFERRIQQTGTMYQGMGVVEFTVFDFEKKSINKLLYQGVHRKGGIEGRFNLELLKENPDSKIYEFILEQEASKSKYIYRTPKDYNIDVPENYIEKWNVDNPDFYNNESGRVKFFFYDENILWDINRYGDIETYKANTNNIENDNYIIFFYFAGPILAIRKSDKKYFVILVPQGYGAGGSWGIRSIKNVELLTSEKIFAQNDYEQYEIDLTSGEYILKRLPVNDEMIKRRLKTARITK
ncbi:MAG TPA: DUF4062 domain-containing protein [Cytophagaceae bacterium]|jgi:hypothetical protein|nr:DUF4062 domain-containing protein [Cytophagaceae bacterium]